MTEESTRLQSKPRCEVCARLHRDRLADYTITSLSHPDGWLLCLQHAYLIAKQRGWSHAAIDPEARLVPIKESWYGETQD